jgi:hypothetical protein
VVTQPSTPPTDVGRRRTDGQRDCACAKVVTSNSGAIDAVRLTFSGDVVATFGIAAMARSTRSVGCQEN